MNGFPLVVLGVALFALAYVLWQVRSRIGVITAAVDRAFRTIEDGITNNMLGPASPFTGVVTSVDGSFRTIGNGLTQNMLGPGGILATTTQTLNSARDLFYQAGNDIHDTRIMVAQDIRKIVTDSETILQDVGDPLDDAGTWLNDIGNGIDIDIAGARPFHDLAQPFRDVGDTCSDVGGKCLEAKGKLAQVSGKLLDAAAKLDALKTGADGIGGQFGSLSQYTNTTFRNGVTASVNDLEQARASLDQLFTGLRNGVTASVQELELARNYLDSQLLLIVDQRIIAALSGAGAVLIATGVAIGL